MCDFPRAADTPLLTGANSKIPREIKRDKHVASPVLTSFMARVVSGHTRARSVLEHKIPNNICDLLLAATGGGGANRVMCRL
jgi:hypothetical protein